MMTYFVKGFDSFSMEGFDVGEFDTKEQAMREAAKKSGSMTLMYVYDENGKQLAKYGTF